MDFYIDSARFLPDNSMWTRVRMRLYTSDSQRDRTINERALADLGESTARNPFFGFKKELRNVSNAVADHPFQSSYDPTSIIILSVETWDRASNRPVKTGFAYFNLFVNKTTLQPSITKTDSQVMINDGCY